MVYDIGEDGPHSFIVTEYIAGGEVIREEEIEAVKTAPDATEWAPRETRRLVQ